MKYGEDIDQKSPFDVSVPKDGKYGFAIRVRNGVGISAPAPQSGEAPSIVVISDATFPVIQSFNVNQGKGENYNQLNLNWKLSDSFLAEKPVSLYYSTDPNGPWEPIVGWQHNTQNYQWTVSQNGPARLFFRILVRDSVGNVAQRTTPQPIFIDLSQPTARILDVAPLSTGQSFRRH